MINDILQFLGLDFFNIKLSAKFYQIIQNGLIINFHFFQNLNLGNPRPIPNVICQSLGLHLVNIPMCKQNFITIFYSIQEIGPFSRFFFRIWSSAKPRPTKNGISQSFGLDLDNINVYTEVYQNIPLSSRDKAIFTFSEFGALQTLDR